jgi:NitT/TauT family transport system substrate-binding protein
MRFGRKLVAVLGIALAWSTTAPGAAQAQQAAVKLFSSAAVVEIDQATLFLGNPLGFFKQEGVAVEFGAAAGSAATLQLLASGQVEMGHLGMDVLILGKAKNPELPVTAVYLNYRGNIYEIVVPEESNIRTVADLAGKSIGVANLASGAIPSLRATLLQAGLNPDTSVQLIPVGIGAQAWASLKTGRVQALSLFRAQHAAIEALGTRFRYFTRPAPSTVIAVNSKFLREHPDAVTKVLRGVVAASAFAQANPAATVREHWKLFGKPQGLSDDEAMRRSTHVLARSSELWKQVGDKTTKWGGMSAADWDAMQQFLVSQKLLERAVATDTLFTSALIDGVNTIDLDPVLRRAAEMK